MQNLATTRLESEQQFASLVDQLSSDRDRRCDLIDLLNEDHPFYDGRGATTVVRMRGWVLLSLARGGLTDDALIFLLEELDTGVDAYLVAAASRALRSYSSPQAAFAPFVMRALTHIRYRDEPISLERYGEYAIGSTGTCAVRELLKTLAWLGPNARNVLSEIESLKTERALLGRKLHDELDRAVEAIRSSGPATEQVAVDCCTLPTGLGQMFSWPLGSRRSCVPIESTVFQDHDGASITFKEFFSQRPSIVVFFYTRCDNPLKCSLTITKLARIQELLAKRGLSDQIQTAAITYDPAFDLPERIHRYGEKRGLNFDERHRMLRAVDGIDSIRKHFKLGVNFIESLVNRHRIEVYILDGRGSVAASFERIHWDEQQVLNRAVEILEEKRDEIPPAFLPTQKNPTPRSEAASTTFATLASLGLAVFPKCPLCWAAYMSLFGIASLERIPYSPWLQPLLAVAMLINLTSLWFRARATGRHLGFFLAGMGAVSIVISRIVSGLENLGIAGVVLTLAGSLLSSWIVRSRELTADPPG